MTERDEQARTAAVQARVLRERRDPKYIALIEAALARAKGEVPEPKKQSRWRYR